MKIHKNDSVLVICGKDKGKKGKVRVVDTKKDRLIVDGVNMIKKHVRPTGTVRQAGIIEREAPIKVSNVMVLCPKCSKPARIGHLSLEDGKKVRLCRACHEVIE
ncbi:MAG: 50S ribosomal protein L24 [Dehalococcoidia bacterium]|nr:50S ribosomal protein L24 [Dehalococcoidia bacterium]